MFKLKKTIFIIAIVLLASSCNRSESISNSNGYLSIEGHKLSVEIVRTKEAQGKGLSGRENLATNSGMLFPYSKPGQYGFWMKDMKFSLDFIWIRDFQVVEITKNIQPEVGIPLTDLHVYKPQSEVDAVLEVNAGWSDANNIKVGDRVTISKAY